MAKPVKCDWGVVKRIWLDEKRVILIYSPSFYETYQRIRKELEEEGIEIVKALNAGVSEEAEEAEKLLDQCPQ